MGNDSEEELEEKPSVVATQHGAEFTKKTKDEVRSTLRKPVNLLYGLAAIMFIFLVAIGIILGRMSRTQENTQHTVNRVEVVVNKTNKTIDEVAGPKARSQQAAAQIQVVKNLLDQVDCRDQQNLQRLIVRLVDAGLTELKQVKSLIEPRCQNP